MDQDEEALNIWKGELGIGDGDETENKNHPISHFPFPTSRFQLPPSQNEYLPHENLPHLEKDRSPI
jgi:hypothetical protein